MERCYQYVTCGMTGCSPAELVTEEELRDLVRSFPGTHLPTVEVLDPGGGAREQATPDTIDRICDERAITAALLEMA
jgi:hypothetical protein